MFGLAEDIGGGIGSGGLGAGLPFIIYLWPQLSEFDVMATRYCLTLIN